MKVLLSFVLFITLAAVSLADPGTRTFPGSFRGLRIVVDPGHGGSDPGAVAEFFGVKIVEKECNLTVGRYLSLLLRRAGAEVLLTRNTDDTVSLTDRVETARSFKADLFISIHHNSSVPPSSGNRTEIYWKAFDPGLSALLAFPVARQVAQALGLSSFEALPGNFMVLRNSTVPALLTEGTYMYGEEVLKTLGSPSGLYGEATALFKAMAPVAARISGRVCLARTSPGERPSASVEGLKGRKLSASALESLELLVDGRVVPSAVLHGCLAAKNPVGAGRHVIWCRQRSGSSSIGLDSKIGNLLIPIFLESGPLETRPDLAIDWGEDRGRGPLDRTPASQDGTREPQEAKVSEAVRAISIFARQMADTVKAAGKISILIPEEAIANRAMDRLFLENLKRPSIFLGIYPVSRPGPPIAVIRHYYSSARGRVLARVASEVLESRGVRTRVEGSATFFLSYTTATAVEISWPANLEVWRLAPHEMARRFVPADGVGD